MNQQYATMNIDIDIDVEQEQRQHILSILAKSELDDIQDYWNTTVDSINYEFIRSPEVGMVMAVARTGMTGEPFNLGEVTVTRCAIKLDTGETGFGYVQGRSKSHSIHIAVIDALTQKQEYRAQLVTQLIEPLQKIYEDKLQNQQAYADETKVDFFTMVRGESGND